MFWCGFAIFWEYTVIQTGAPIWFRLFGIPLVMVGPHLVFGRFFFDAWQRARTLYVLTDRRAIIVSRLVFKKIQSVILNWLEDASLTLRGDGSGTIALGRPDDGFWTMFNERESEGRWRNPTPKFELIHDAQRVCDLLLASVNASPAGAKAK